MTEDAKVKNRELMRCMILAKLYKLAPNEGSDLGLVPEFTSLFSGMLGKDDVSAALTFLVDSGFLVVRYKPLGSSKWYRISSEGVLTMEREYSYLISSDAERPSDTVSSSPLDS